MAAALQTPSGKSTYRSVPLDRQSKQPWVPLHQRNACKLTGVRMFRTRSRELIFSQDNMSLSASVGDRLKEPDHGFLTYPNQPSFGPIQVQRDPDRDADEQDEA